MDAPTFISSMTLYVVVGVTFVVLALFETVVKSKPKPDYTKRKSE